MFSCRRSLVSCSFCLLSRRLRLRIANSSSQNAMYSAMDTIAAVSVPLNAESSGKHT